MLHLSQVQEVCKWAYLHSLELRFHGSLSSLGVPCDQTKGLTLLPANAGLIWWCSAAAGIPHPAPSRILVLTGTKPLLEPPGRNSRATQVQGTAPLPVSRRGGGLQSMPERPRKQPPRTIRVLSFPHLGFRLCSASLLADTRGTN